jgi:hypothetical protein
MRIAKAEFWGTPKLLGYPIWFLHVSREPLGQLA